MQCQGSVKERLSAYCFQFRSSSRSSPRAVRISRPNGAWFGHKIRMIWTQTDLGRWTSSRQNGTFSNNWLLQVAGFERVTHLSTASKSFQNFRQSKLGSSRIQHPNSSKEIKSWSARLKNCNGNALLAILRLLIHLSVFSTKTSPVKLVQSEAIDCP